MTDTTSTGGAAEDAASGITKATGEWADRAADRLDSARQPVADKLHGAADAIRSNAQRLYGSESISEGVSDVAHGTADRIESSAAYLESHDVTQMMKDMAAVVKRYPAQALLIAGAVGFLCGRAFRSH